MRVTYLDLEETSYWKKWDDYVETHPDKTPHHRSEYLIIIKKAFNHHCFGYVAENKTGKIMGVLPIVQTQSYLFGNYATSIPFFNNGGILASSEEAEQMLVQAIKNFVIAPYDQSKDQLNS